jgi:1-acyl-sn-glycerol-3-phosphate acyltransferase
MRIHMTGVEEYRKHKNALVAGNHVSYLDVIVYGSQIRTCFVTSVEIKETPFLGQVCLMGGCLFVERRSRTGLHKEIDQLKEGLERGLNVTIFPEATSTNGERILRFRRPLFLAAIQAQKPVIPICVNYQKLGEEPVTIKNRDKVCWYGDMPFASHLWDVCGFGSIDAEINFLPAVFPPFDAESGDVAAQAQASVESVFRPIK